MKHTKIHSVNVRGYGSLQNAMYNQSRSATPVVGMGATELMYSDRHPYTIIEVINPKRIKVRADRAIRVDKKGESEQQDYKYIQQHDTPGIILVLNKSGRWKQFKNPKGSTFLIGKREEYYDFTR